MELVSKIFTRMVFYPTLAYNGLLTQITGRKWYDRIDDTVILGALPVKWISRKLVKSENIGGIISLNEEYEMKLLMNSPDEWKSLNVTQLKIPALDFIGAPSTSELSKGVQFILKNKQENKSVYVHCKAGRTRSTTLVVCYLIQVHGWSVEEAISYIRSKRPHIVLRKPQLLALKSYKEYSEKIT